jgi:hypothetical protein
MFRWDPRAGPMWIHEIFVWDPHQVGLTHFWFVWPTILLWDSWLKKYVFSFCKQKRPYQQFLKLCIPNFIYKLYFSQILTNNFVFYPSGSLLEVVLDKV